ncbi:MAG: prolipoprotein diacylglyceryl transferase, partial [Malacoplasma sp.]|nr:prolipoprotein diacylglyceryl transferase [Malacoplasma sp.]
MNNFFSVIGMSLNIDKVAFKIGDLEIAWYGIFFTIGFILAIIFACVKLECWYKISCTPFYWFVFIGIPVSLLGARTWSFVIGDSQVPLGENFFSAFFNFRQGGLAIEGGVALTVIAAFIYFPLILKKPKYHVKTKIGKEFFVKQVSMWVYADAIVPCILVGQIIGRWGNFFNQEVYGPATTAEGLAWLKNFMPGVYENMFIDGSYREPFFLYESFFNFWFFIALYVGGEFIKKRKAGDLAIGYFICYGLLRTCMEPFRNANFMFVTSIVTSVLFLVFGIGLLVCNHLVFARHRDFKFFEFIGYKFCEIFGIKKRFSSVKKELKENNANNSKQIFKFSGLKKELKENNKKSKNVIMFQSK